MIKLRAWFAVIAALLLIGVFSPPPAHAQGDARRATPPPGRALVFVFRSEREPVAAQVPVSVNATAVGRLANGSFLTATVNPGRTFVRTGDRVLSAVAFQAEPNRSYFVRIEAVPGVSPVRTETRLVSEAEGRRSLAQSRFIGAAPAVIAAPRPTPPKPALPARKPAPAPRVVKPAPPAAKPAPPRVAKPAPPPPAVARVPDADVSDAGWALIAKAGNFKLATASQVVGRLPSTYATASKPVFGLELEWRSKGGLAVGGEVFYYKNDLVATGTTLTAQQEIYATTVNGKYYFRVADWFYPFVGAGIGYASAAYGGDLTGKAAGPAYQGMTGAEFRFNKDVGVYVQYKHLVSTTDDGTGEKVKVGGGGVLAGLSILF